MKEMMQAYAGGVFVKEHCYGGAVAAHLNNGAL